jgi:hypothetical protein
LILNLKESIRHSKVLNAAIMKELGWKKYGDDTNTPDVSYMGEDGIKRTKWVQYNLNSPNPIIEGTDRLDDPTYT